MEEHGEKPYLVNCPSFGNHTSDDVTDRDRFIYTVHSEEEEAAVDGDDDDDDFEFAIAGREPGGDPSITAAELFSGGQMLPVYPVFNRNLLENDSTSTTRSGSISSTSSEADELAAAAEHCVWSPRPAVVQAPERCQKSASTGTSRRWRIRDLMVGRSHSDGKEKFASLGSQSQEKGKSPNPNRNATADKKGEKKKKGTTEMDMVTAHRLYYSKVGGGQGQGERRSFLPYRQDLVGFFAGVNGFSGSHHPH